MAKRIVPLERDVMKAVAKVIRLFGLDIHRQNTGAMPNASGRYVRFGKKGDADYAGMLPDGRRVDLEIKRPGKRPTPEQYARLNRTNEQGGVGIWTDDAADLARMLPAILAGGRTRIGDDGRPVIEMPNGDSRREGGRGR